jgi:hypothetical protein
MAGKSASLLTKTQRNRIQDDFSDLDEQKKHRDQQRIRERVRSGLLDFQLLTDYPDHQLALMFDDVPDDEVRAALADTTILIERLREQSEIEREELVEEVRTHIERRSNPTEDTRTLEQINLRTAAEIRRQTEDELAEQFGPGRWDRRANGLMKLGVSAFILLVLGNLLYPMARDGVIQSILGQLNGVAILILIVSAVGWILINTAQWLKYSILPFFVDLSDDPKAAMQGALMKRIKNPWETLRESWDEL